VDNAKVQALKQELEQTKRYEGVRTGSSRSAAPYELGELARRFRDAQDRSIHPRPSWRGLFGRRSR